MGAVELRLSSIRVGSILVMVAACVSTCRLADARNASFALVVVAYGWYNKGGSIDGTDGKDGTDGNRMDKAQL